MKTYELQMLRLVDPGDINGAHHWVSVAASGNDHLRRVPLPVRTYKRLAAAKTRFDDNLIAQDYPFFRVLCSDGSYHIPMRFGGRDSWLHIAGPFGSSG